jgi:hypothetical protein
VNGDVRAEIQCKGQALVFRQLHRELADFVEWALHGGIVAHVASCGLPVIKLAG